MDENSLFELNFRQLCEDEPGAAWREVYRRGWPGWREWFLARGGGAQPLLRDARQALRRYMPAIQTSWARLVDAVDADEDAARFLTFWNPPRYLVNCSQLAFYDDEGPGLIRNYDLDPKLNESTILSSSWSGRRVIGMVDALSGLADGMNEHGLAVSLAFGGRPVVGRGFGVPKIIRYVLEYARDVPTAVDILRGVPSHMSYNVTMVDRSGAAATVFLSPDRPPIAQPRRYAANHQIGAEWPQHARISNTIERERHLGVMDQTGVSSAAGAVNAFLSAPLYTTGYSRGFGTVYTALYRPRTLDMTLFWLGGAQRTARIGGKAMSPICISYGALGAHEVPQTASSLKAAELAAEQLVVSVRRRNRLAHEADWDNLNGLGAPESSERQGQ